MYSEFKSRHSELKFMYSEFKSRHSELKFGCSESKFGCVFRVKAAIHSGGNRAVIPEQNGQPFRRESGHFLVARRNGWPVCRNRWPVSPE